MRLIKTVLKFIVFVGGWAVCAALLADRVPAQTEAGKQLGTEMVTLLLLLAFTLIFHLAGGRQFRAIPLRRPIRNVLYGAIAGAVWLAVVLGLLYLMKVIAFSETRNEVSMREIWMLSCFVNVVTQELLIRGYLYRMIQYHYRTGAAVLVTAVLFAVLRGFGSGVLAFVNAFMASVLLSLVMCYTESVIAPILMHGIWNCVGGVIYGCVVLSENYPHSRNPVFSGREIMTGGDRMLEGTAVFLIVNVIFILSVAAALSRQNRKKSRRSRRSGRS